MEIPSDSGTLTKSCTVRINTNSLDIPCSAAPCVDRQRKQRISITLKHTHWKVSADVNKKPCKMNRSVMKVCDMQSPRQARTADLLWSFVVVGLGQCTYSSKQCGWRDIDRKRQNQGVQKIFSRGGRRKQRFPKRRRQVRRKRKRFFLAPKTKNQNYMYQ